MSTQLGSFALDGVAIVVLFFYFTESYLSAKALGDAAKEYVVDQQGFGPGDSGLHESWLTSSIGGRLLDKKDAQWHSFRDGLPLLGLAATCFLALSHGLRYRGPAGVAQDWGVRRQAIFYTVSGVCLLAFLHETGLVFVLLLSGANYALVHAVPRRWGKTAAWTYNLSVLVANQHFDGYKSLQAALGMDRFKGETPWHFHFNLVILRMLSWALDYFTSLEVRVDDGDKVAPIEPKERVEAAQASWVYSDCWIYFGYLLYPPLYIAGPTITFNSFASHLFVPQRSYSRLDLALYGLRFLSILLLFELFNHYLYVGTMNFLGFNYHVAVHWESGRWVRNSLADTTKTPLLVYLTDRGRDFRTLLFFTYWSLKYLWLKFLLIWRGFRLWALLDGVEPPENMQRCMTNNYTVRGFWRGWHCSFNKWLVRYIYIPLGGSRCGTPRTAMHVCVVFTFVGLWHDLKLQLLAWSWLFSLFLAPEIVTIEILKRSPRLRGFLAANPLTKRIIVAMAGGCNIMMLMLANVVGYTTGLEGAALLWPGVSSWDGLRFTLYFFVCMCAGTIMMQRARGEICEAKPKNA